MVNYNLQTFFNTCIAKYKQENQLRGDIFDAQLCAMLLVLYESIYKDYMKQKRIAQENGVLFGEGSSVILDDNTKEEFIEFVNEEFYEETNEESDALDVYVSYIQTLHFNMHSIVHLINDLLDIDKFNPKIMALNIAESYRIKDFLFDKNKFASDENLLGFSDDVPLSLLKDLERELRVYGLQHLMKKPISQKKNEKKDT